MTDLQQDAPSAPPAGWYPDPVRPGASRYWSGTGWTDQVSEPVSEPIGHADPAPVPAPIGPLFDIARVAEAPTATFGAPLPPTEQHASQYEWHQSRPRTVQRSTRAPVAVTSRTSSPHASAGRPYDRNWVAGLAIVLAVLSIPAVALRVLWDLPPLTQSIIAGAPIGIALLAFAKAARGSSGLILSIVSVVICAATLVVVWVVDPAVIREIVDGIVGLLPK